MEINDASSEMPERFPSLIIEAKPPFRELMETLRSRLLPDADPAPSESMQALPSALTTETSVTSVGDLSQRLSSSLITKTSAAVADEVPTGDQSPMIVNSSDDVSPLPLDGNSRLARERSLPSQNAGGIQCEAIVHSGSISTLCKELSSCTRPSELDFAAPSNPLLSPEGLVNDGFRQCGMDSVAEEINEVPMAEKDMTRSDDPAPSESMQGLPSPLITETSTDDLMQTLSSSLVTETSTAVADEMPTDDPSPMIVDTFDDVSPRPLDENFRLRTESSLPSQSPGEILCETTAYSGSTSSLCKDLSSRTRLSELDFAAPSSPILSPEGLVNDGFRQCRMDSVAEEINEVSMAEENLTRSDDSAGEKIVGPYVAEKDSISSVEFASCIDAEVQERASSPNQRPGYVPEPTYKDSSYRQNEDSEHHGNEILSVDPASFVMLKLSEGGHALNLAQPSSSSAQVLCDRASSRRKATNFDVNGPQTIAACPPPERELVDEQPAKRTKKNGTGYSGADAVAVVLGQTAEIVLVLAGMAQMRAGRPPTPYERQLAATAYDNLGNLVSRVSPSNLVSKEALERMLHEFNTRSVVQKMREDQAWLEALTEAEALANAREEARARAKVEATAIVTAEAEELERRLQASLKGAAIAANGPLKVGLSTVGGLPSSGQSTQGLSELVESPNLFVPAANPCSQAQIVSQALVSLSKAGEAPRSETLSEKSMSVNGQSQPPAFKPLLGRPPKVRNRIRKDPSGVTLFTPEFLNLIHNQTPEPQKAQVTHKQLCLGVQQFIREHIPPVCQTLQALPPTYISTPYPCQVCKLIARDTGSVLVCDSCDEVSHVKCVKPPLSKGATKGDWNCPKCVSASQGGKCPSKYGPIRHGSPNSVKLWPPHDRAEGYAEPNGAILSSVSMDGESLINDRQIISGVLKVQERARLEIDTGANQSKDDPGTGNFGSSPHLIVHLVNEPSPRNGATFHNSSRSLLEVDSERSTSPGRQLSTVVQPQSDEMHLVNNVAIEDELQPQRLQTSEPCQDTESGFEEIGSQFTVLEDSGNEEASREGAVTQFEEAETRVNAIENKKAQADSAKSLMAKQADISLPIVMEWVGESIRRAEGKAYYQGCSVGGITFSLSDCALFRPETPDVPPYIARLQVLWEDIATGYKWVRVSWCYYPSDIPLAMGHPGTTEPDEVYESNHCDNNLVGSIQGPCFVLSPLKFLQETERRNLLKKKGQMLEDLPPIFLSRFVT